LVCVGGDVGDEFLGGEREEALQGEGGGGGGEAGEEEVVRCYGVGYLVVDGQAPVYVPYHRADSLRASSGVGEGRDESGGAYYRRIIIHF